MKTPSALLFAACVVFAPAAALAQDSAANLAECRRAGQEISSLATRNLWDAVERAFVKIEPLGCASSSDYRLAAEAARAHGDVSTRLKRLIAAKKLCDAGGCPEGAVAELAAEVQVIKCTFGPTRFELSKARAKETAKALKNGTALPAILTRQGGDPFVPDQAATVAFARAKLAESGVFSGWVVSGSYEVDGPVVVVAARDEGVLCGAGQ